MKIPKIIERISKELLKHNAKAIVVGGSVRDHFLELPIKDYDVEVYGLEKIEALETILTPYGSVNLVGKSFGVLKFVYEGEEYDFSFPRTEQKVAEGHRGFDVTCNGALSFKDTGSINAGTDKDIEINVTEDDSVKDAIGMGVKVTVSTLNVDGNVGEKAEITAHDVQINGQTHQSSIIRADKVEIDIHKGYVYADEVTISRLEAGLVEAEIVNIKEAIGGVIRAREVHIHNLFSHIKIYSSKKIEIDNILGSENLIVIDLEGYKDGINEIEETRTLLMESSKRVEYLHRLLKEELDEVLEARRAFTISTKRLRKFEDNEVEPPESLMDKIHHYQEFLEHYKEMKEEIKVKKEKVAIYEKKFAELEEAIFYAELKVHDNWKGYNKIEFRLINPKKTLEKIQNAGNIEASFKIQKIMYEDDQFEIITKTLDEIKDED